MHAPPIIEHFAVEARMRGMVWVIEWLLTLTEDIDERRMHNDERPCDICMHHACLLSHAIFTVNSLESELVARPALNRETFVHKWFLCRCAKKDSLNLQSFFFSWLLFLIISLNQYKVVFSNVDLSLIYKRISTLISNSRIFRNPWNG